MGSISGGNYISSFSGDQIDAILGKANTYPAATAQDAGKVPTVQNDGTIALNTPAAGGVTSFNGRTGAVTPQSGDYTAAMVGARADTWTPSASDVGATPQITYQSVTLAAANWSSNEQTVTVTGVSATETDQLIQPVPASASRAAYQAAGVQATAQAANSLTFTCASVPASDLTVYVCITELEAAI